MISTFRCRDTERIFKGQFSKKWSQQIQRKAAMKLDIIHAATRLDTLRVPPGNRLETLSGDRAGQHSIRINDQWRICFAWKDGHAHEVEIVDYHK